MKFQDTFTLCWWVVWSVATFLAFGFDKGRAAQSGRRVPESLLLLLAALGGWLGGWLGMYVFRHKTAKLTFKLKYGLALLPFATGVWAWLHWR